uniref:Uncharacterized protein n=1 Tax=Amphimedon queenslandica TaxID=400682 RepID=A0A1X7TSY8_AMPQE
YSSLFLSPLIKGEELVININNNNEYLASISDPFNDSHPVDINNS